MSAIYTREEYARSSIRANIWQINGIVVVGVLEDIEGDLLVWSLTIAASRKAGIMTFGGSIWRGVGKGQKPRVFQQ